jgi:NitT/TauT family transport system ATP-binding protein
MGSPSLVLDRVCHSYGDRPVLQDLSLTVGSGEFVAIVGASGCGKSTILQIVAGLLQPKSGRVRWGTEGPPNSGGELSGGNVDRSSDLREPQLAFVFQEPALMPWATVAENVRLPLKLRGWNQAKSGDSVRSALAAVGLADRAQSYPAQLSGGMKMRVSIARALVTQPEVMLLDEPFGALDDITRSKLNDELANLSCQHGWTTLFVTHNIYEAVYLADQVLIVDPVQGDISDSIEVSIDRPRSVEFRMSALHSEHCRRVAKALAAVDRTKTNDQPRP